MTALTLLHLTFVGPGKEFAAVDFDRRLTVIYGASDTGKSFIVEAIDYMLGASSLKQIPEADGYTRILLGLRLANKRIVTISCTPAGNKVAVHDGDVRTLTSAKPMREFNFKHSKTSSNSLSRYLLGLGGADGRCVLKNARREQLSLSFRHLAHLCVINETQMASPRSPVLTSGQVIHATAEKSVFRYLLTGRDEPEVATGTSEVEKKVGKGKIDLLDQLIAQTRGSLSLESGEAALRTRLERIEAALAQASSGIEELVSERSVIVERMRVLQAGITDNRARAGEVRTLVARFHLLHQQYDSDLARLEMVAEAGTLLGYFRVGICVFCGAAPEHQRADHHVHETTRLQAAVTAETRKTTELSQDLLTTIDDLEAQLGFLDDEHSNDQRETATLQQRLARLEERLRPMDSDNRELLAVRAQIQTDLAIHAQVQRLEDLRADLSAEPDNPQPSPTDEIGSEDLLTFERLVQQTLLSWQVPGDNNVSYNQGTAEIIVDGRERGTRGKGMRSIIHAAFTAALALYTTSRDLPHPGFVVLDSPVLTYREPHEQDVLLTHNVVEHFYQGLLNDFPVQTVVIENGDPPEHLDTHATVYAFSTEGSDRAGFFPPTQTT
ncbi:hypothetical protein GCM10011609_87640 [Lentzea pudingi]|uniref:Rad50/SbcC-type AAA domain-containing protein n=1 Tax=Lentzea pudingi TaxID=1789439 RepID=A0ABQ2IWR4_9PSEU|nr:ATP-binding protein [Lentzea pudingi]GGN30085.1 hypothetical protein GCM10011609_87640 [Lentzea pudingi]